MNDSVGRILSDRRKKYVIQIDRRSLFIFIMLCITVRLGYVSTLGIGEWIYRIGLVLSVLYIIVIYIRSRSIKIRPAILLICFFQVCFAISTTLYSGISFNSLLTDLYPITFVLMIDIFLQKFPKQTIQASALFFEILIYLNCLVELFFPNGLYNEGRYADKGYFLLGHQNHVGIFLLIALLLGFLRFEMTNRNPRRIMDLRLFCLFAVGVISILVVWSVTSLIGIIIFLIVYLFQMVRKKAFPVPIIWALFINLIIFAVLAVFQNTEWMNQILNIFGRNDTLTGRTRIWDSALLSINSHPFLGVGSAQGEVLEGFSSAHNRYLHILYIGGILAFAVFLALVIYCCIKLQQGRNHVMAFGLIAYLWAVLSMCQAEVYLIPVFYIVFIIIQHQNLVFNQCVENNNVYTAINKAPPSIEALNNSEV